MIIDHLVHLTAKFRSYFEIKLSQSLTSFQSKLDVFALDQAHFFIETVARQRSWNKSVGRAQVRRREVWAALRSRLSHGARYSGSVLLAIHMRAEGGTTVFGRFQLKRF